MYRPLLIALLLSAGLTTAQNLVLNGPFEDSDFSPLTSHLWDWNPEDGGLCWDGYALFDYNQAPDVIAHFAFLRDTYALNGLGVYCQPCNPVNGAYDGNNW